MFFSRYAENKNAAKARNPCGGVYEKGYKNLKSQISSYPLPQS